MDGIAAARALTPPLPARTVAAPAVRAGRFDVEVAAAADDGEIRRLLRESAFSGQVSLSFEREPDSALAASIEGDVHESLVARDRRSGLVAAIAARAVRDVFVNGTPSPVAYLGQLRIDARFRPPRGLLEAGFDFCRQAQRGLLHFASIVEDNAPARRLLSRRVRGWPRFEVIDRLVTLVIPLRSVREIAVAGVELQAGSRARRDDIVGCLGRNGCRYQFFPDWRREHFDSPRLRGVSDRDFVVALGDNRAIGCLALWDQRTFKQAVVRAYSPGLRRSRRIVNLLAPLLRTPRLPDVGRRLELAYLSHAVADGDDERTLISMAAAACVRARGRGLEYVAIGLPAQSPALRTLQRTFPHRRYQSLMYAVIWPEGEALAASLDGRPANPEIALL